MRLIGLHLAAVALCSVDVTERPLIGILTEPVDMLQGPVNFIAGSYVKFVEGAGARVVPVPHYESEESLIQLFSSLHGVLLPGGGVEFGRGNEFYQAGMTLAKFLDKNPEFPVFGTCLGFQLIACLAADDPELLITGLVSSNISLPLKFIAKPTESSLFRFFDEELIHAIETEPLTYNSHRNGLNLTVFKSVPAIKNNFRPLSVNVDANGVRFVSAFESRSAAKWKNILAVQFHPEKSVFEWMKSTEINHSLHAVQAAQNLGHAFIDTARKYKRLIHLSEDEEVQLMIQNRMKWEFQGAEYFQEIYTSPAHTINFFGAMIEE